MAHDHGGAKLNYVGNAPGGHARHGFITLHPVDVATVADGTTAVNNLHQNGVSASDTQGLVVVLVEDKTGAPMGRHDFHLDLARRANQYVKLQKAGVDLFAFERHF